MLVAAMALIFSRLSGDDGNYVVITEIKGDSEAKKPYIVAMRHSSDKWICLPCTIKDEGVTRTDGNMEIFKLENVRITKTLTNDLFPRF